MGRAVLKLCATCGNEWADDTLFCPKDGTTLRAITSEGGLVGSVVADRYRVIGKLGQGGMGTVYVSEHVKIGRRSAIKVIDPTMAADPQVVTRFNREAANAARINHPNVCAIYDFGETPDGLVYIAMEYVDGQSLKAIMQLVGTLPPRRAADIVRQIGDALQAAHDLGIVHRDLKPDNVMITPRRDGSDLVKVVDFGIAKAIGGDDQQHVTKTGLLVGTPEYMSPEQVSADAVDGRSDIYSLALVLFRMLTGSSPFRFGTVQEAMVARLADEPMQLADVAPGASFPPGLQRVLNRALARAPDNRYSSATEFAFDVVQAASEAPAQAEPSTDVSLIATTLTHPVRRRPAGPTLGNRLHTFTYLPDEGWSVQPFPSLDSDQTLVIAFGAPEYFDNPAPLQALCAAFPKSHVVGCSSAGEIFAEEIQDRSLAVAVFKFHRTTVRKAMASVASGDDSFTVGTSLAGELNRPDLRAVLVLSDGIEVNGSELVRGLNSVLPNSVVVTGGLAGDGDRFQRTWVLCDGAPQSGGVVAVGLYGDSVIVGHGSRGGWDIFGPERVVTRAANNVLYELDGKPALELYKRYLGDRASGLPAAGLLFPLALRRDAADEKRLVRTILAVNEDEQSMTFAGDIAQGSLAQFMTANFDRLVEGAATAANLTQERISKGKPGLAVAISCVGRRLVLGERTEEETEATLDIFPPGTRQIGFYSYGEISPYASGHCDLHNQTMTLTFISEA